MDLQPGALFDLPFVAELLRIASTAFVGVTVLMVGGIVFCIGCECGKLRKSLRQETPHSGSRSPAQVPAGR